MYFFYIWHLIDGGLECTLYKYGDFDTYIQEGKVKQIDNKFTYYNIHEANVHHNIVN